MLQKPFNVKNFGAVATGSLTPKVGQGFRVKNIHCTPNAAVTEFLTVQVDRMTVGYIHVGSLILNQASFQMSSEPQKTIFEQMRARGIDVTYPVPEGSTLTITASNAWARLSIVYEIWDAEDVKADEPNGPEAKEYTFFNYGTFDTAISVAGTYTLNKAHNPVEFPDFPFGAPVPSKTVMEILGIGCPAHIMNGATPVTDYLAQTHLRLFREREVLFDEDRLGIAVEADIASAAGASVIQYMEDFSTLPYGGEGTYKDIFLLPSPLSFAAGEELAVQVIIAAGGTPVATAVDVIFVCMPIRITRE